MRGLELMFVFVCVFIGFIGCFGDEITSLPDAPQVTFKQYSGYIILNETTNKSMFYWLQTSINDPVNDPLVLWTNGGGLKAPNAPPSQGECCSGLLGAMIENGAYRVLSNGSLGINPYSWNNVANMLFVEVCYSI